MINKASLLLTLFFSISIWVQADKVSDKAEVYLVTCNPGAELYSIFGHSAIWFVDTVAQVDNVYNYGVFDFNTPNFYGKFLKGKLLYQLDKTDFETFVRAYILENRTVYLQRIYLKKEETRKLYEILEVNYLPENRYYLYDFLFNNCSSKIIDQFDLVLESKESINHLQKPANRSFRNDLHKHLEFVPWIELGIDIALGNPTDEIMTIRECMFLPLNLMANLNNGRPPHLSGEPEAIFEGKALGGEAPFLKPGSWLWMICVMLFILLLIKVNWITFVVDSLLFEITGILGCVVAFLWFISDHQATNMNLNILWAMPFNVLYIFRNMKVFKAIFDTYLLVYAALLILVLISWTFLPQYMPSAVIPVLLLLIYRSVEGSTSALKLVKRIIPV